MNTLYFYYQTIITNLLPSSIYLLPLSFITFFFLKWLLTPSTTTTTSHTTLPPSPPKLPLIGNLHQLGTYPHHSLTSLSHRYGPLMLLHFGKSPALIVSSSDAAREIMKTHDAIFSNRPKSIVYDKLIYNSTDLSVAQYGEYWRQMRSICVLNLLSNKRVQSFRSVRVEETEILIKKIRECKLLEVNLSEMLMNLTNHVVCRVAFGRKYSGEEGKGFKQLLGDFVGLLGRFNVGDYLPWLGWMNWVSGLDAKMDKVAKDIDGFLDGVVEEHKRKSNGDFGSIDDDKKDFVDILLEIKEGNLAGFAISIDNIKALLLDMFAGGTDTTYTVLEWAMTELLRHPNCMKKLQEEVRGILNGKSQISDIDLTKMHYLHAVIKETLRLYPPIPLLVPRKSTQNATIKGYDIEAETLVIINAWAIGRDPKSWEDPLEFRPERFMNSSIDFRGHDFELIPFGAGRRGCPGISFAMATNEIVLANLVWKFDWNLPKGMSGKDLDMKECSGLTIHRKVPLFAIATPCDL